MRATRLALLLGALSCPALADTLPAITVPTLALEPAPTPSIWHGLSVGAEVLAVSSRHGGGFGGDVFAGYDRAFANGVVLGIRGSTGVLPAWGDGHLVKRFDFAATDIRVGYAMGRLTPYVTAGVALARPRLGAGLDAPGDGTLNAVLNGAGETRTLGRVGAGVDYALTDRLTIGVAVQAIEGRGAVLPLAGLP